ncbi:arsenical pump-driving ATPase [Ignatzschineria sp. LJL83]
MNFIKEASPFLFFTGKGGVGKTSIASSTAVTLADMGKKVLIVSTDPASNIAQVFGQNIGSHIIQITSVPNLSAIEINPHDAAEAYRKKIIDPIRGTLPEDVVVSIEEQLSGACTTEIAAFDEFTALLTNSEIKRNFDHIVFDTAPTGHTIRMLQLPGAWSDFLETSPEGASCLGPLAGLEKQKEKYKAAVDALSDENLTTMVLVTRAQKSAINEVSKTFSELYSLGIHKQYLVVNGLFPKEEAEKDDLGSAIYQREQQVLKNMPENLSKLPIDYISLKSFNLVGIDNLRLLLSNVNVTFETLMVPEEVNVKIPDLASMVEKLAEKDTGLVMLMGKGGVGKTTMAAAIAVKLAEMGKQVHLSTSDPAAHLASTLNNEDLSNLTISRIDPATETERYRQEVMKRHGDNLSDSERAVLEEDLRSPCTEEIATFQAFSRIIRESNKKIVVMDTAPTGHTLLLLDATGAYHNEVIKQMGSKGVTTPMMQIQNSDKTKIILVTLAETTPITEAEHLEQDLGRAGIKPWGWIINNTLVNHPTRSGLLIERALKEKTEIEEISKRKDNLALVGLQSEEPTGIEGLSKLSYH